VHARVVLWSGSRRVICARPVPLHARSLRAKPSRVCAVCCGLSADLPWRPPQPFNVQPGPRSHGGVRRRLFSRLLLAVAWSRVFPWLIFCPQPRFNSGTGVASSPSWSPLGFL